MRLLYGATLFASALLLFWVQLMVGRLLLPRFGGTPAVWTTCLVFSQAVLLLGYLYAHAVSARLGRWAKWAQAGVVLVPLAVLPVRFDDGWVPPADGNPIPTLLALLAVGGLLPMFALSTTAPLLQKWFADTGRGDPYVLYAASNLGSLVGLLGYPLGIEPQLDLAAQGWAWAGGYGVFAALTLACAVVGRTPAAPTPAATAPPPTPLPKWERARWVTLSAVPAALLPAVTTVITTEIAPIPLLWVLPLGLYLLTFVIAFGGRLAGVRRGVRYAAPAVAVLLPLLAVAAGNEAGGLAVHTLGFGLIALALHDQLAARRPPAERLTEFYLWLSVGGVAGGLFSGLLAPNLFPALWEYPLALVAAAGLTVVGLADTVVGRVVGEWKGAAVGVAAAAVVGVGVELNRESKFGTVFARERNSFGVVEVFATPTGEYHVMSHGNVIYGAQYVGPKEDARRTPRTYYHPSGPIGDVFEGRYERGDRRPVGVIGLGAGAVAAYAEPGEQFTFFEINPAVVRLARESRHFTYLSGSNADLPVVLGDARLALRNEPDGKYSVLVVDAFGGDAIPVHLLTREAVELYRRKLTPDGLVAFHVTNKYLELEPVLGRIAADLGVVCYARKDIALSEDEQKRLGKKESVWVVLAGEKAHLHALPDRNWRAVAGRPADRVWTDQYCNVFGALGR